MTSKLKNINRLRADKLIGFTPAQFLCQDRCRQFILTYVKYTNASIMKIILDIQILMIRLFKSIIFFACLTMSINSIAQDDKLPLKRKIQITNNIMNATDKDYEVEKILMDSLFYSIFDIVDADIYSDIVIYSHLNRKYSNPDTVVIDSLILHYYSMTFIRGGTVYLSRGFDFDDKKEKRKTFIHEAEFEEYIYDRKEIPYHLIEKLSIDLDVVIGDNKYYVDYDFKCNNINDIEIIRKCLTRIR